MHLLTALLAGLLFGVGLILSGMGNPTKVLGFLDFAGAWDPSLALVMVGAIAVSAVGFRIAGKRTYSLLGAPLRLPTATQIDRRLVLGSLTFGIGWGLAGYCPGPALATVLTGGAAPATFVAAMLAGMAIFAVIERAGRRL